MDCITVPPIVVGYDFRQSISFVDPSGSPPSGFDLTTASRLFSQLRGGRSHNYPLLGTLDSAGSPPGLIATSANVLTLVIPQDVTSVLEGVPKVWMDFARLDGTEWSLIPVQIGWPTVRAITVHP
jgi:hypothetical protein